MKKTQYTLEYPIKNASTSILWELISSTTGLSEWFADNVRSEENDKFIFTWDGYDEIAYVKKRKDRKLICFQWEDDTNTDYYFQIEILKDELSKHKTLIITDFAEEDDREGEIMLWEKHIEDLRRHAGI